MKVTSALALSGLIGSRLHKVLGRHALTDDSATLALWTQNCASVCVNHGRELTGVQDTPIDEIEL